MSDFCTRQDSIDLSLARGWAPPSPIRPRVGVPWTAQEDADLRAAWAGRTVDVDALADKHERTPGGIIKRAQHLGLIEHEDDVPLFAAPVTRPAPVAVDAIKVLRDKGLHPAVAEVAFAMARGQTVAEIIAARGVDRTTVAKQLRRARETLGAHNDADLRARCTALLTSAGVTL